MGGSTPDEAAESSYSMTLADGSYGWYQKAATRARTAYRISEIVILVTAAAVPVSAVISPGNAIAPGVLGGVVVVASGLRSIFHWQDNYLRFSGAREAVEAERRRYRTASPPYEDPSTRDQILAAAVTRIEQDEMSGWVKVAAERPKP
jgi:hypothetical protein